MYICLLIINLIYIIMTNLKHAKHQRQSNREPKNMSKSIRLDIKKFLNRELRKLPKKPNLSPRSKRMITEIYTELKSQFAKS